MKYEYEKQKQTCRISVDRGHIAAVSCIRNADNQYRAYQKNAVDTEKTLGFIEEMFPETEPGIIGDRENTDMPLINFSGTDFAAVLEYPRFSYKAPVASLWNKYRVFSTPCRFSGSVYDGSLIIGGVDNETQFGFADKADIGDVITVTDMHGDRFVYVISKVHHAKNAAAKTLAAGESDLTLFSKDKKTGDTIIIRCKPKQ